MVNFDHEKAFGSNYDLFKDTWMNNGFNEPIQSEVSFDDLLATPNASEWLPRVTEEILREPVEPILMADQLLDKIAYKGAKITFPAIGGLVAEDVAENQAFREQTLQIAPGTITASVGKSGLQFRITDEMRRHSQFDVINMHLTAARRAMARHKEKKAFDFINSMGTILFDNKVPGQSVYGTCTGRDMAGTGNGSCRVEDLVKGFAHLMMQGFNPNALLMHPLTWSMWLTDPVLQAIVKNTGNGSWYQPHTPPKAQRSWDSASQGGLGVSGGFTFTPGGNAAGEAASGVAQIDQRLQSKPGVPSLFPYPFTVLVSPFVPFNPIAQTADLILFDSANLGAIIEDYGLTADNWTDMYHDAYLVKVKESYGFGMYNDGLGIATFKNIPVVPNEIALPVQATIDSLTALDPTVPIVGL